ncbi:MAG: tetratricopeptide repeat protein [Nitrosopumilus sp.]|nr:tetratricopeptide repeat protein [Nitrosopumilus sp.]
MATIPFPPFFHSISKYSIFVSGIILGSIFVIYQNDLRIIFEKATNFSAGNIANFVLVIPILIGYVIYKNRNKLNIQYQKDNNSTISNEVFGIIIIVSALVIFIYGNETFYVLEYHILSMIIFGIGSTIFLLDVKSFRKIIFAFVLALFLIPIPAEVITVAVSDISPINSAMIHGMLNNLFGVNAISEFISGYPVITVQNQAGDQFTWHIGESSSGLYSMVTLSALGLFLGYILGGQIWKRAVIFGLGFLLMFLLNIVRISIMMSLWYYFDENVSESFHMISGSLMISLCTFILLIIGTKLFKLDLVKSLSSTGSTKDQKLFKIPIFSDYKKDNAHKNFQLKYFIKIIAFVLIAATAILSTVGQEIQATNSESLPTNEKTKTVDLKTIGGGQLTLLLPEIHNWELDYLYRDIEFERDASMHLALWLQYAADEGVFSHSKYPPVIFGGVEIWDFVHRWEASLVWPGRPAATIFEQSDIQILDGIKGRLVVYQMPNTEQTDAVLYWIKEVSFSNNGNIEKKYVHLVVWSNVDYLKSIGMIESVDDVQGIEEAFLTLARPMNVYWNQENILLSTKSGDSLLLSGLIPEQRYPVDEIPYWVKVVAEKWANSNEEDTYNDDNYLIKGIEFLLTFENSQLSEKTQSKNFSAGSLDTDNALRKNMPYWFKQNIKWWQEGSVSETEILRSIQHMLDNDIVTFDIANSKKNIGKYDTEEFLLQANMYARDFYFTQAIKIFDQVLEVNSQNVPAIVGKANTLLTMRQVTDAIHLYDIGLEIDPYHINGIVGKANALAFDNKNEEAVEFYNRALEIEIYNINAIRGKIMTLLQMDEPEKALIFYSKILDEAPQNLQIQKLNEIFDKNSKKTSESIQNNITNMSEKERMYLEAEEIFSQKDYESALNKYQKILEMDPDYANAIGGKAASYHKLGDYDKAIFFYDKAISLEPDNLYFLGDRANLLVTLERIDEAIVEFEKILSAAPFHFGALNGIANAYAYIQNYEKELFYRDQVLKIDFRNIDALVGKGNAYAGLQKYDYALEYYEKALEFESDNVNAINGKANVYVDLCDIDSALQLYNKTLEIDLENQNAKNGIKNLSLVCLK